MVTYCLIWLPIALYGRLLLYMVIYGHIWALIALYGHLLPCLICSPYMITYCLIWFPIALNGNLLSFTKYRTGSTVHIPLFPTLFFFSDCHGFQITGKPYCPNLMFPMT